VTKALKQYRGFTLIELMIAVSIIAILAAIAIAVYQNFTIRSQVASGLAEIRSGLTGFESQVVAFSRTTFDVNDIGLSASTPRCTTIDMEPGAEGFIRCTLRGHPSVNGETITLRRQNDDSWVCQTPGIDSIFRPVGCE